MSFLTVVGKMTIGDTKAAHPTMSMALKMFDPTTLPTARSAVPLREEISDMQNSGMEVPMATMVSPMTSCGKPIRSAIPTEPSVSLSAP